MELTLSVATDDTGAEFQEIDSLYLQVDENGATTYPLEINPSDWPSSLFALEYVPVGGESTRTEFRVQ